MIEKVNPCHPDKVADRIAGAIVDLAYSKVENPKIAVEVLLGHGVANIIIESSVDISQTETEAIVSRITKREDLKVSLVMVAQDPILAHNQDDEIRCGDNGIFKGVPLTDEERLLSKIAHDIYGRRGNSPWIAPAPLTKYLSTTEHEERQVTDSMHLCSQPLYL